MLWRSVLSSVLVCSSVGTTGCYLTDDGAAEAVAEAASPQLDPGGGRWRLFKLTLDGTLLAKALVIGDKDAGAYDAKTEYWSVNTAALQALGTKTIAFSHSDGDANSTPPSQQGGQSFALPRDVTWTPFTTDPASGGSLYKQGNVYLRIATSSSGITRLTWYQVLPGGAPANLVPSGTFSPVSGPVSVPSGHTGYVIDQWIQ